MKRIIVKRSTKDRICYDGRTYEPCVHTGTKKCNSCAIQHGKTDLDILFDNVEMEV